MSKPLKIFISYTHDDEVLINEFKIHMAPLIHKNDIVLWQDRQMKAGSDWGEEIDDNLEDSDIVCLFISAKYLSSPACIKEVNDSFELAKQNKLSVVPIILSSCAWLDNEKIPKKLVLPLDGKAVESYNDHNDAWLCVYHELKKVINDLIVINSLKVTENFKKELNNSELLTKAHSKKESVFLTDIFVYPMLLNYGSEKEYYKDISSKDIIEKFSDCKKILVAGESQSGKTFLAKKTYMELVEQGYVPVLIEYKEIHQHKRIKNEIPKAFMEQYGDEYQEFMKSKLAVIIDDFHYESKRDILIGELEEYCNVVLFVDDIFNLNLKDDNITKQYSHYKIKELTSSMRYKLIKKWVSLSDLNDTFISNDYLKEVDKLTELVDTSLGKVLGSAIMPSYPFFVLSVISTYELADKPLDEEITSQGYCYQALIYFYLRKEGVKKDDIGAYINFLTEFSFFKFKKKKSELSKLEFDSFLIEYTDKFNMPVKQDVLLKNLKKTQLLKIDSFGNHSFYYEYLYYFFVARFLTVKKDYKNYDINIEKVIKGIIENLHLNSNAYIAIFMAHHSSNMFVLDELKVNSQKLFNAYTPATLTSEEVNFFDNQEENIVQAVMPRLSNPDQERVDKLDFEDKNEFRMERSDGEIPKDIESDDNKLEISLRRSLKTVEVMGQIIKNRAGSLEKAILEDIFENAMNIHLRLLSSFFELIEGEEQQQFIIQYVTEQIKKNNEKALKDEYRKKSDEELQIIVEKEAEKWFWNTNFAMIYSILDKIILSLGSDKLTNVINKVCDRIGTPAAYIVKQGSLNWHYKSVEVDDIEKKFQDKNFSFIAQRVMKHRLVDYCRKHQISHGDKQRISSKLDIKLDQLDRHVIEARKKEDRGELTVKIKKKNL